MVVDDEYDIVRIVQKHLEKWGFEVDTFTNPLYALEVFKKNSNRYSVVLTDINMPEMRGTALAKLMQTVKSDVKIVIMTAYEIEPEDLSINLPTITHDQILKKPFSLLAVCGAIKKQLATMH